MRIVGNGTDKEIEELKTRIKNANLLGKVEFCGFKQGKDLLEEYQYASVFVLPTREDCFGLVLLEAACTGTPIVTSKYADGAYDIITENVNGSIIDPYNARRVWKNNRKHFKKSRKVQSR
ncbi:MAG: glycosyltransferase [Ruminococcus sp.]